jgi:PAS domain S-box-containing protein
MLSNDTPYLRALFEILPVAVLLADDNAQYVDANTAACALFERPREALVGAHVSEIVAPGHAAAVDVQWAAFVRDGEQSGLFDIRLPGGAMRRIQFHARANFVPGLHVSFMSLASAPDILAPSDKLLTMCAWTKRVRLGDEWLSIERYLSRAHGVAVSHGIAPDAFEKFLGQH